MKYVLKNESAHLSVDYDRALLVCAFFGDVKFEDYQSVLLAAAEEVRSNGVRNVIMDRSKIEKIDAQCRIWVKNEYLKNHIKPLVPKINKVAAVNSVSIIGHVYGKAIYQTLSFIYPSLTFKFFSSLDKASAWFREEDKGTMMVEDVLAMDAEKSTEGHHEVAEPAEGKEHLKKGLFNKLFDALFSK